MMTMRRRLEPALRDDQDVAGLHIDVGGDVPALDQILESDPVELASFGDTEDARRVAVREVRDPSDRDHHIEHSHLRAVWQYLRRGGFADNPDLLVRRSTEICDDYSHHRVTN